MMSHTDTIQPFFVKQTWPVTLVMVMMITYRSFGLRHRWSENRPDLGLCELQLQSE